jgi:DNA-directed RNA polymerase specialized sigma24 family protein
LREYEEIESEEEHRRRRIYRGRTVTMLRRYLKYSIETGRLPSLLGQEFFRAKVTTYSVVTFEDRVIFVHDMEKCLRRLDEFSRELIARHVLQEHDRWATARLLHCSEKTVRRLAPVALDQLCEIMLEVGLMERQDAIAGKSCQGGLESEIPVSDCEESENNF